MGSVLTRGGAHERASRQQRGTGIRRAPPYEKSETAAASPKGARMRILIVSPVRLLRDGLATILEARERVHSVGRAANAETALAVLAKFNPTLILLDVASDDGLLTARRLMAATAGIHMLGFAAREYDHDVLAYAEAGMAGFVPRDASIDDVFEAIDRAMNGELLCSPSAAGTMYRRIASMAGIRGSDRDIPQLTGREHEIVHYIDVGLSNKEIARELRIGVSTVKNHVHNILEKLRVNRRGEAAAHIRGIGTDRIARSILPGS
jgi:DNA-binding NarL/FixJ family response regulator